MPSDELISSSLGLPCSPSPAAFLRALMIFRSVALVSFPLLLPSVSLLEGFALWFHEAHIKHLIDKQSDVCYNNLTLIAQKLHPQ